MIGIDKVKVHLMMRETSICSFYLSLSDELLTISNTTFDNTSCFNKLCNESNLYDFIMSRMMPSNNRKYINIIAFAFQDKSKRYPYGQLALSLATNCVSLSDHFWLNPEKDISFDYLGKTINFKRSTWEAVNAFNQGLWDFELNQFAFHDMLFIGKTAIQVKTNNPIFTTDGMQEKTWNINGDAWYLNKRLTSEDIDNECQCLDFFKNKGFITPLYSISHYEATNRYQFHPSTIRNGFDVLSKSCITSQESWLLPLNKIICADNESLHNIIFGVTRFALVDKNILTEFEKSILEYVEKYNIRAIDPTNVGFVIRSDNSAIPTVWSSVEQRNHFIF